jgi:hypothetical protein
MAFFLEIEMISFRILAIATIAWGGFLLSGGCSDTARDNVASSDKNSVALSVEFPDKAPLRYQIVSKRDIALDLDPSGKISKPGSDARQDMKEEARFILAYKSLGPAGRGGSLVEVTCENATVKRLRLSGGSSPEDALTTLAGKSFKIKISATGQIFDTTELDKIIHDLGEAAFGNHNDKYEGRRIKNPDMIADFIAAQWYMWDQEQCVPRPVAGVALGEKWRSKRLIFAPMPYVSRVGRNAQYELSEIEDANGVRTAVIKAAYTLADGQSTDWPMPYSGTFSQRGSFGFFHSYKVLELSGTGTQVFDIATGKILREQQVYDARISAMIPFGGLGKDGEKPEPNITVRQTITIELLPAQTAKQPAGSGTK